MKQKLFETNHDFVLIQDSGESISHHDSLTETSLSEINKLVGYQVELARMVVKLKPDTQVFIGSLPPRFDTPAHAELADAYNNTLVVETFIDENVTIVSQNDIYTNVKQKISERFCEDGATLTKYGTHLMVKNIRRQIADKVPHIRQNTKSKTLRLRKFRKKTAFQ